jgi:hypothetical protein
MFDVEFVFYEVIEFMEIEVSENLTHEITERQPYFAGSREKPFMFWKIWIDVSRKMRSRIVKNYFFEKVYKYSLSLSLSELSSNFAEF